MNCRKPGILCALLLCVALSVSAQEKKERQRLFFEMKGGSKVSGSTDRTTLPVRTSYARMDIKIELIDNIAFSDVTTRGTLSLKNGDRLQGEIALEKLSIAAAFGKADIAVEGIKRVSVVPSGGAPGLLLWNRLDGGRSLVGPDVEFLNIERHVRGKSGEGVQVGGNHVWALRVPGAIVSEATQGTIEYWMKVVRKPATVSHGNGPIYDLLLGGMHAQYNANDGNAHGKYSIGSARHWVYTETFGGSKSTDLLGKEGEWNHYAIVWDAKGIEGLAGTTKLAFFIDGRSHGRYQAGDTTADPLLAGPSTDYITIHRNRNGFAGTMVYDELKIWDHAMTEFGRSRLMVPPGGAAAPRRVGIDLVDGSHVRGTLVTEKVTVVTGDLGSVSVPRKHVVELVMDDDREKGTLILAAGDELAGTIGTPSLAVKTVFGDVTIAIPHVSRVMVVD